MFGERSPQEGRTPGQRSHDVRDANLDMGVRLQYRQWSWPEGGAGERTFRRKRLCRYGVALNEDRVLAVGMPGGWGGAKQALGLVGRG